MFDVDAEPLEVRTVLRRSRARQLRTGVASESARGLHKRAGWSSSGDKSGKDLYVNVDPATWKSHEPGDVITADNPLVNRP